MREIQGPQPGATIGCRTDEEDRGSKTLNALAQVDDLIGGRGESNFLRRSLIKRDHADLAQTGTHTIFHRTRWLTNLIPTGDARNRDKRNSSVPAATGEVTSCQDAARDGGRWRIFFSFSGAAEEV